MAKMEYYECPVCQKTTRHIQLSVSEASAMEHDSEIEQAIMRLMARIGMFAIFKIIYRRDFWKCCDCGKGTLRASSGKIIRHLE